MYLSKLIVIKEKEMKRKQCKRIVGVCLAAGLVFGGCMQPLIAPVYFVQAGEKNQEYVWDFEPTEQDAKAFFGSSYNGATDNSALHGFQT